MNADDLSRLVNPLRTLLPYGGFVEDPNGRALALDVDDATRVIAHDLGNLGRLVLTAEIASLPEADRAWIKKRLLAFNRSGDDCGRIWISFDEAGGTVRQSLDLPIEGLTQTALRSALERFLVRLRSCRTLLEIGGAPEARIGAPANRRGLPAGTGSNGQTLVAGVGEA